MGVRLSLSKSGTLKDRLRQAQADSLVLVSFDIKPCQPVVIFILKTAAGAKSRRQG